MLRIKFTACSISLLLLLLVYVHSYMPSKPTTSVPLAFHVKSHSSPSHLRAIIYAESVDESYDEGLGGVRLAQESAIVMKGIVKGTGPMFTELTRYTQVTELKQYIKTAPPADQRIPSILENAGLTLVCTGTGTELYKDPGEGTERIVILAPVDAAKKALSNRTSKESLHAAKKIFINFMGGDDLMAHEVIDAVEEMVQGLDISSTSRVTFHSLCHADFPLEKASVAVIALNDEITAQTSSEFTQSIERGEIYFHEGKWWTTLLENINHAVA